MTSFAGADGVARDLRTFSKPRTSTQKMWSAVAERSGDTAFARTAEP